MDGGLNYVSTTCRLTFLVVQSCVMWVADARRTLKVHSSFTAHSPPPRCHAYGQILTTWWVLNQPANNLDTILKTHSSFQYYWRCPLFKSEEFILQASRGRIHFCNSSCCYLLQVSTAFSIVVIVTPPPRILMDMSSKLFKHNLRNGWSACATPNLPILPSHYDFLYLPFVRKGQSCIQLQVDQTFSIFWKIPVTTNYEGYN
jgi:hypothetical protein